MTYLPEMLRHIVTMESTTMLPKDRIVNTWYTNSSSALTGTQADAVAAKIVIFYNAISTWGASMALTTNANKITTYRLSDPLTRVPINVHPWTLSVAGPDSVSREVAMVLSFQAAIASGQNPRRRKSRIYLGPWNAAGNNVERPGSVARTLITNAAKTLNDSLLALTPSSFLAVHSQVNAECLPAIECWMDDAWDTQRRRGYAPTTKTIKTF